jgi:cobalt-zinc-cadmium efflux system outer membrane protein
VPQTWLAKFGRTVAAAAVAGQLCGCISSDPDPKHLAEVDAMATDRLHADFGTAALLASDSNQQAQQPTGELSLQLAIGLTLRHNLSLVASAENVALAQAALAQAGLLQNPTLGENSGILFPIAPVVGRTPYDFNLSQEINSLFTLGSRIDTAKLERMQAGIDLASQAFDLAEQVDAKYQELKDDLHSRDLARRTAELYERSTHAAEAQANVGVVARSEVNRAKLQAADARRQVRHLDAQYARAARELNWLMGFSAAPRWHLPPGAEKVPRDVPSLPPPDELERLAEKYRLDLLRADFDRKLGRNGIRAAKVALFPALTLGIDGGQNSDSSGFLGPFFNVTVPIFDPGLVALKTARLTAEKNDRTYAALAGQARQDVRTAYANLAADQADLTFYRDQMLPQQDENVRLAQESFDLGNDPLQTLLDALRDYVAAQQQYADAITAYHGDAIALERAVGLVEARLIEESTRSAGRPSTTQPGDTTRPATGPAITTQEAK